MFLPNQPECEGLSRRPTMMILIAVLFAAARTTSAQCPPQWIATAGVTGGGAPTIFASTLWDPDGAGPLGPVLVVAGEFTTAGGTPANNIAIWDGATWSALGAGVSGGVNSLAILQNGHLVAAGSFATAGSTTVNNIAQWDGTTWSPIGPGPVFGTNNTINSISVRPNGDLIIGGAFTTVGGAAMNRLARWNGLAWSSIGSPNGTVWAVLALSNGDVIIGGQFTPGGGINGGKAARWNGAAWSPMGALNSTVLSFGLNAAGEIIAGGLFTASTVPVFHIARWDGAAWAPLGAGIAGTVWAVAPLPNGDLVAGGVFLQTGDGQFINSVAGWNGTNWYQLGSGLDLKPGGIAPFIGGLTRMPNGDLYVGGEFPGFGGGIVSPNLARWGEPIASFSQNPAPSAACAPAGSTFIATASGMGALAYEWQIEATPGSWIMIGSTPTALPCGGSAVAQNPTSNQTMIQIAPCAGVSAYQIRCVVTDACGKIPSNPATFGVFSSGTGDANGDGAADGGDIQDFVNNVLAGGTPGPGYCACDFTGDGSITLDDAPGFVNRLLNP